MRSGPVVLTPTQAAWCISVPNRNATILAFAMHYYRAGRATTAEPDGIPTGDESIAARLVLAIRCGNVARAVGKYRANSAPQPEFMRITLIGEDPALVDAAFNLGFKMRRLVKVGWDKEPDAVRRALAEVTGPYDPKDDNARVRRHRAFEKIAWAKAGGRPSREIDDGG
jgi:hypothetical protein